MRLGRYGLAEINGVYSSLNECTSEPELNSMDWTVDTKMCVFPLAWWVFLWKNKNIIKCIRMVLIECSTHRTSFSQSNSHGLTDINSYHRNRQSVRAPVRQADSWRLNCPPGTAPHSSNSPTQSSLRDSSIDFKLSSFHFWFVGKDKCNCH